MAETYSAGVVTAYGAAVRGGYTGTYEEFCAEQAEFAENAAAVAQAKEDVETMQGQVEQAAVTFIDTTVPAAETIVQEAGAAQVQAIQYEGTMQGQAVETVGAQQKAAVEAAGSDAVDAVETAETAATGAVTAAQTAAVQAVQTESSTQQAAIQTKGQETIASIPEDYTALSDDVDDLKNALGPNELAETASVIARASGAAKWAYSNGAFSIARSSATVANTVLVFTPVAAATQFLFRLNATGAEGAGVDVMIVGWETEPAAYGTAPTQTFFKQAVTTSPASIKLTVNVPSGINYIGFKFVASRTQENLMTGTLSIQTTDKLITKVDSMEAVTDAVTASVKYVSTTGNDVNDGDTPDTAYATIGKALSGAATTIYIATGNYSELNGIPENTFYRNNSIKIIADNATLTIKNSLFFRDCNVDITGLHVVCDSSSDDTANSFFFYHCSGSVKDCTAENAKYMGYRLDSSNLVLTRCSAVNCVVDGFNAHTLSGQPAPVITLVDCIAHDCGDDGASVHESGKMFVHGGEFYNNVQAGLAPHALCEFEAINVHCHHNAIGIEAVKDTLATGETPATGRVIGCILDHNTAYGLDVKNYTVNTLGNAYADNTSGKTRAGAGATINAFVAD